MTATGLLGELSAAAKRPMVLSAGSTAIVVLANVVTGVVLARTLGPAGRGQVAALAGLSISICTIAGVSLADAVVFVAGRNSKRSAAVLSSAFALLCVTMLIAVLGLGLALPLLLRMGDTHSVADVAPWILFAGLSQASLFVQTLARTLNRLKLWFWLRVMATWNYALILLAFALTLGMNARLAGVSICLGAVVTAVVGAGFMGKALLPFEPSRAISAQLLGYGVKLHPSSVAATLREQLDKVILILIAPAGEVGRYVVALALGSLIVAASHSVDQVAFPRLSRILDFAERRSAFERMLAQLGLLLFLGAPVLTIISPGLARLMFGPSFASEPWLIICGVAVGILHAAKVLASIGLKIENKPGLLGAIETIGSFVGLVALVICVKFIGIYGAPLGSGIGAALSLAMMVWIIFDQYAKRLPA
jgi:O-antigen/teichoic acid export membrane protein